MNNRNIYLAVVIFTVILIIAGLLHLTLMSRWQLYLNMKETDDKQNEYIIQQDRRIHELETKLAIFEQHLKTEAKAAQGKCEDCKEKAR